MKIELKNISVFERMSEETTAFNATLYIDGKKAGTADNRGNGEMTNIRHGDQVGKRLIEEAEIYCKGLPPIDYAAGGEKLQLPMDLATYVDLMVSAHLKQKDLKRFQAKLEKDMEYGIVFGNPENQYRVLKLKSPIHLLMNDPKMEAILIKAIHSKVLPAMEEGDKILNTNFTPAFRNALQIDQAKLVALPDVEKGQDKGVQPERTQNSRK